MLSNHLEGQLGPPVSDEKVYACDVFAYSYGQPLTCLEGIQLFKYSDENRMKTRACGIWEAFQWKYSIAAANNFDSISSIKTRKLTI